MKEQALTQVERKPYHTPQLIEYGNLATLTMGGAGIPNDLETGSLQG